MNLGAFMNPEFPIFSTTLCYLELTRCTGATRTVPLLL